MTNTGKTREVYHVDGDDALEREMAAYDALSQDLRRAMRASPTNKSALEVTELLAVYPERVIIQLLRET